MLKTLKSQNFSEMESLLTILITGKSSSLIKKKINEGTLAKKKNSFTPNLELVFECVKNSEVANPNMQSEYWAFCFCFVCFQISCMSLCLFLQSLMEHFHVNVAVAHFKKVGPIVSIQVQNCIVYTRIHDYVLVIVSKIYIPAYMYGFTAKSSRDSTTFTNTLQLIYHNLFFSVNIWTFLMLCSP